MKLVIDLIGFEHGKAYGFEEFVFNLLKDFKRFRYKINADEIIIVGHSNQRQYFLPLLTDGISFYSVNYKGVLTRRWQSEVLANRLKLTNKDVVLYPGNNMPLNKIRAKKILVVHDLLFMYNKLCEHTLYFTLFRLQQFLYVPQGARKADEIIAISNFTKNDIIKRLKVTTNKINTIYNYFCFDKYSDSDILGIERITYPYILSVCAGNKHKGHKVLLESFSLLAKDNNEINLVLVGSLHVSAQSYFDDLSGDIRDRIHFLRHISNADLAYLYRNARAYVSASLFEGLGMPVVEALYFGLPVILSDIDVHREISFNRAVYFAPQSSLDLYKKVKGVLDGIIPIQPVDRDSIEERYSSNNTSLKYIEVINSLIKQGA